MFFRNFVLYIYIANVNTYKFQNNSSFFRLFIRITLKILRLITKMIKKTKRKHYLFRKNAKKSFYNI